MSGRNVLLFVPNLIGYLRLALIFASCYWMLTEPVKAALCFALNKFLLDDLDGIAARRLHQVSLFGTTLDPILDQTSFIVWVSGVSMLYSESSFWLLSFLTLDTVKMMVKVNCSLLLGEEDNKASYGSAIVRFYYSQLGLHTLLYGSDSFFIALYLRHFNPGPSLFSVAGAEWGLWQACTVALFPLVLLKAAMNLLILKLACQQIVELDHRVSPHVVLQNET